jgi:hypothetical protein
MRPDQALRSALRVVRPVPAQVLQMIRSPRSRMRPVPQHRTQVSWATGGGPLWLMKDRLPNSIRVSLVLRECEGESDAIGGALKARRAIA